jgi:hypothetical protein
MGSTSRSGTSRGWGWREGARAMGLAFVLMLLSPARQTCAQTVGCDRGEAKRLFAEGMKLVSERRASEACAKFQQSLACHPRASTETKIARCREKEGKLASALSAYQRALTLETDPKNARAVEVEIRRFITQIELRVPRLTIAVEPPGETFEVRLDETAVPFTALGMALPVDPGEHHIVVDGPGHAEQRIVVALQEGAARSVLVKMLPLPEPAPAVVPRPPPPVLLAVTSRQPPDSLLPPPDNKISRAPSVPQAATPSGAGHTAGLVLGGAGVASLLVAGFFGLKTAALVREADQLCNGDGTCDMPGLDRLDDARRAQRLAIVLGGLGVAAVGTAVALFVTSPRRTSSSASNAFVGHSGARAAAATEVLIMARVSPAGARVQVSW